VVSPTRNELSNPTSLPNIGNLSIGIKAMSTNEDQIEKFELYVQKLTKENTKQFEDLEKSLENIASSIKGPIQD
jgi:hypothetical protein